MRAVNSSTTAPRDRRPGPLRRLLDRIPPETPLPPVRYAAPLSAYVAVVSAGALTLAALTVRAPSNPGILAVAAAGIFLLALATVRSVGGVDAPWSPNAFVHLAVSFALGPVGAFVAAIVQSLGFAIRMHTGWFRAVLNAANIFLVNLAAYGAFHAMSGTPHHSNLWPVALSAIVAGAVSYVVNSAILAGAVTLSSRTSLATFVRSTLAVMPHDLTYGLGAAGFSAFATLGGTPFLVMWLAPLASNQISLFGWSIQANARTADRERHARERVDLLQRVIRAADDQRFAIAADLHDGHVNDLVGLAMQLDAAAQNCTDEAAGRAIRDLADAVREMQRNVRGEIYAYSPHDLDKPRRLRDEVERRAEALRSTDVDVSLDIPDVSPLDRAALELIFQTCVEAISNMAKHARATAATITLSVDEDHAALKVEDNGRGFTAADVERRRAAGHFGTRFLSERAEAAGGRLTIRSEAGHGTRIELLLPTVSASERP
jgi:signal transduction histidine kinase